MSETEVKKLSANDAIVLMVNAINKGATDGFYKAVEQYQKTLSYNGEVFHRLRRLLNDKPKSFVNLSDLSNDIKKLIVQHEYTDDCVYLNSQNQEFIKELLTEWKNAETFKYHNLGIRNKILLHGPTGNGKTTIARHIARLSELPFVEVNADIMIDSHLGSTGANIHKVFNQITMPCVLFWDEVDTIGRARGRGNDSAAGMENERMVNSILVNIEKLSNEVVFIGATNRRDVLDSAFLRRFDSHLEISAPTAIEKESFARKLIEHHKLPFDHNVFTQFDNYAEIKLAIIASARKFVLSEVLV